MERLLKYYLYWDPDLFKDVNMIPVAYKYYFNLEQCVKEARLFQQEHIASVVEIWVGYEEECAHKIIRLKNSGFNEQELHLFTDFFSKYLFNKSSSEAEAIARYFYGYTKDIDQNRLEYYLMKFCEEHKGEKGITSMRKKLIKFASDK